jgi:phage baseplate assembly protein W
MSAPVWHDDPLGFDARGRTRAVSRSGHIRDLIREVLFTSPGERVNRPEFGCALKGLVFAPISDPLVAATQQLIQGSLIRWLDPVIAVESVTVERGDAVLTATVVYAIRDTGERREDLFQAPIPA